MQLALSDPIALALTALGLLVAGAVIGMNAIRHRRLRETANRLAFTALDGRPEEARVEARNGGRRLAPLLDALAGELTPPQRRAWLSDAVTIVALHLPVLLLVGYGASAVRTSDVEARLPAAAALFVGLAVAWPVALVGSTVIVAQARKSARALRATCISLIAKTVKTKVDAELSENLRRGGLRDPRGE